MKVNLYNQKGEEVGKTDLPSEIFDVKFSSDLVHQVVVSQMANQRQVSAHTKNRGEVRGGGKKPWRQKGTGRARHGSIRSPLWKGGGVTFGPTKERNFKKIIPKKMRRKALFMVLSQKKKDNELIILNELKIEKPKTKEMENIVKSLELKVHPVKSLPEERGTYPNSEQFNRVKKIESILVALPKMDENIILAARNIPKISTIQAKELNCLDILNYKYLMLSEETIKIIKDIFVKPK